MSLPVPNLENYNQQVGAIQAQIASLRSPQAYSPMPTAVRAFPVYSSQVKYVDGIAGAKEYQSKMPNNSSEIIMDKNEDLFYVVSKDANGACPKSMPIGRFTIEQEQTDEPQYVTRKDFDAFEARITKLLQGGSE